MSRRPVPPGGARGLHPDVLEHAGPRLGFTVLNALGLGADRWSSTLRPSVLRPTLVDSRSVRCIRWSPRRVREPAFCPRIAESAVPAGDADLARDLNDQTVWFLLPEVVQSGTATIPVGASSIAVNYNVPLNGSGVPFDYAQPGDINLTPLGSWTSSGMKQFWLEKSPSIPAGTFIIHGTRANDATLIGDQPFAWKVHVKPGAFPLVRDTMPFGTWAAVGSGLHAVVLYEAAA